jgi:hypothetical protein
LQLTTERSDTESSKRYSCEDITHIKLSSITPAGNTPGGIFLLDKLKVREAQKRGVIFTFCEIRYIYSNITSGGACLAGSICHLAMPDRSFRERRASKFQNGSLGLDRRIVPGLRSWDGSSFPAHGAAANRWLMMIGP